MRRLLIVALGLVLLQASAPQAQAQYRPGLRSYDDQARLVGASDNEGRFFRYVHEQDGSREVWWGNRLIAIEKADATVVAYAYDEHGARIQTRITKPGSQPQLIDHVGGPPVITARLRTAVAPAAPQPNTTRPHQYGRDAFGHLTTVSRAEGTTIFSYFNGDPRPLVREVTYPDGSKDIYSPEIARAAFEALQPLSATTASGSTATATLVSAGSCGGGRANRVGFNGYFWDCEVRLYYTPAGRMYESTFGRFLQQDSYLGDIYNPPTLHRYTFGRGNPYATSTRLDVQMQRPRTSSTRGSGSTRTRQLR